MSTLTGACDSITDGVFSPDTKTFLAASNDGGARLWDVATGRLLAGWHLPVDCAPSFNPPITHVAFRDDGKTIALGFYEKTLELVNLPAELASAPSRPGPPRAALVPPPRPPPERRPASSIAWGPKCSSLRSRGRRGAPVRHRQARRCQPESASGACIRERKARVIACSISPLRRSGMGTRT